MRDDRCGGRRPAGSVGPVRSQGVPGDPKQTSARAELARRLARVESRGITSLEPVPPFWTEAEGCTVVDADGRRRLDFSGAFGVALAGHRHPLVARRIACQAGRLVHGMGDLHPPASKVEFLEALAALMPWPDARAILGLSGSDAVEAALKTAQLATGRMGVVAFEGAYHGLALGALAATHRDHFRRPFTRRLADHVAFAPFPGRPSEAATSLDAAARAIRDLRAGAVIVEPIQGRAGVRLPPPGFVEDLAAEARARGALLIADEIFTGLGRTGALLACSHDGVVPDLVCLGKPLGGGLPLSACCGPARVMDAWAPSSGEAVHTSTFLGHPLACAAGLGFLDALRTESLAERADALGRESLAYLRGALPQGVWARGRGLMIGVGPVPAAAVAALALDEGLIVLPAGASADVVQITPPAVVESGEMRRGLEILVAAVRSARRSREVDALG